MAEKTADEDELRKEFDATILETFLKDRNSEMSEQLEQKGFLKRRAKFRRLIEKDTDFYIVYHCANMAATWMSLLSGSLFLEISDEGTEDPLDEQVAALAFFSRLANDLWAIIELVELGFDLQARALTRAYLEHVDVLICCIQDRELTREFVHAREPEEANAFWHKHISKNRAKAKVSKYIAGVLGLDAVTMVDVLREDAEFAGSALLHPTVMAGLATVFGDPNADYEDSYPIFPCPIPASAGVFRTILVHLFWLSFATGGQPHAWSGTWRPIIRTRVLRDNLELQRLSSLHTRMFQFLLDNEILMTPDDSDIKV
ncbi:MAG: hypothetical protein KDJ90_06075 [Nitratireductor sp.]|nr:hypothetical protein [Nitratireductor sp.]